MRKNRVARGRRRSDIRRNFQKLMNCLCSGEQLRAANEMVPSSESLAINDHGSEIFSRAAELAKKPDTGNIEEAELSLRESGCLNYEVCCLTLLIFLDDLYLEA